MNPVRRSFRSNTFLDIPPLPLDNNNYSARARIRDVEYRDSDPFDRAPVSHSGLFPCDCQHKNTETQTPSLTNDKDATSNPEALTEDINVFHETEPVKVTPLANIINYTDTYFMDVLINGSNIYILGAQTSDQYFIQKNDQRLLLGTFTPPLSYLGNMCLINDVIYVLIYHVGSFVCSGGRSSDIARTGTLFVIQTENLRVTSFRGIALEDRFMLLSGDGVLYLLNGGSVSRFNPTSLPSWTISLTSLPVSACAFSNKVLLLLSDEIVILSGDDGSVLTKHMFDVCNLVCCICGPKSSIVDTTVYLAGIEGNIVTIIQGCVDRSGTEFTVLSTSTVKSYQLSSTVDVCYLSTWPSGYVVWIEAGSSASVSIYNGDNICLSTTSLHGLSTQHIYQPIPLHISSISRTNPGLLRATGGMSKLLNIASTCSEDSDYFPQLYSRDSIPVLINTKPPTYINDILVSDSDETACILTLTPSLSTSN